MMNSNDHGVRSKRTNSVFMIWRVSCVVILVTVDYRIGIE